ncbi:MAG: aldehyde dehydrogenase family protein, partial [Gammaproteobacteria bacterium]
MTLKSVNPATNKDIRSYQAMADDVVDNIIGDVQREFESWRSTGFAERSNLLRQAATLLQDRKHEHARLMVDEMGKTLAS